jgi:hypothetical protein
MMEAFHWAGFSRKNELLVGGTLGFFYLTAIEVMDGFSNGWGYSWGDQLADGIGCGLAITQGAIWKEQRIQIKYSYSKSGLAQYNPGLLGQSTGAQLLKDYNAQTYWLSFNPVKMFSKDNRFPAWLNLALGYSAYGMVNGHDNYSMQPAAEVGLSGLKRERQFYLSLDVDLTKLKVRSRFLRGLFSTISMLKFPAPAIEFTSRGVKCKAFYY